MNELELWNDRMIEECRDSLALLRRDKSLITAEALGEWLFDHEESDRTIPDTGTDDLEPYLTFLRAYQRLNRSASQLLLQREILGLPPILKSPFADTAVASLIREAYLDVDVSVVLALSGLDVQTATIIRHLLDVYWRAMVLSKDPSKASKMADVAFADSYSAHKRASAKDWNSLNPAALLAEVVRIEVDLDGFEAEEERTGEIAVRVARMKRLYYDWLSNVAHGSGFMVTLSTLRISNRIDGAPIDPFDALGRPTARGIADLSLLLSIVCRFWDYFPRIFMPSDGEDLLIGHLPASVPALDAEAKAFRTAVMALNGTMERYRNLLWTDPEETED